MHSLKLKSTDGTVNGCEKLQSKKHKPISVRASKMYWLALGNFVRHHSSDNERTRNDVVDQIVRSSVSVCDSHLNTGIDHPIEPAYSDEMLYLPGRRPIARFTNRHPKKILRYKFVREWILLRALQLNGFQS